jgi:hypothetical protein
MTGIKILRVALCAAALQLTGACAVIVAGTTQDVLVETTPKPGAECQVANNQGSWTVTSTPGIAKVHRAYGDLFVTCANRDGDRSTTNVASKTGLPVFGNIILGGVIGITVDIVSGAAYDYPPVVNVDFSQSASRFPPPVGLAPSAMTASAPMAPHAAETMAPAMAAANKTTAGGETDARIKDLQNLRVAKLISETEYERRLRFLMSRL